MRARAWLDALAETWQKTDLVEEECDWIHAAYERITVAGPEIVGVRLTAAAHRHLRHYGRRERIQTTTQVIVRANVPAAHDATPMIGVGLPDR